LYNDLLRLDTSVPAIKDMFPVLFDYEKDINKSFISRFLDRNHLSMRSVVAMHPGEDSPTSAQLISGYLDSVRRMGVYPENIVNIDLTSVYSDARYVKHAGAKGSERPRRHICPRGQTDKNFTCLRGDGQAFLFYSTKSKELSDYPVDAKREFIHVVPPKRDKSSRPRINDFCCCLDVLLRTGFLKRYSIVLVDAETALRAPEVVDLLYKHDCIVMDAAKGLGWIILPTDQRYHSISKRRYYRNLARRPNFATKLSPLEKFELWREAYWSVNPDDLVRMFQRNGLISSEDSRQVAARLLSEGHRMGNKFIPLHQLQLRSYLEWRIQNGFGLAFLRSNDHLFRGGPFWEVVEEYL